MNHIDRAIKTITTLPIGKVETQSELMALHTAVQVLRRCKTGASTPAKTPAKTEPVRPSHVLPTVWACALAGRKIDAIKEHRSLTNMGLADSKDFVELHCAEALQYGLAR